MARVRNSAGIHCRPSTVIVERARDYRGEISVQSGGQVCDLRSVMGLMILQLHQGAEVRIRVNGPNEAEIGRMLVDLFENRFDFPPQTE